MILIVDTDQIDIGEENLVTHDGEGIVTLAGTFREACIADAILYLINSAVGNAVGYHYETYHEDDQT